MEISLSAVVEIFVTLLFIGFFAGVEIAFVSANKLSLELNKKQGNYAGKIWGNYAEHPARFIGTILVITNVLLVIYGLLIGVILKPFWNWIFPNPTFKYSSFIQIFFEIILSTFIVLFVEVLSKALFRARNKSIIYNGVITYVVQTIYSMFSWVASVFVNIAEWILQYIFNVKITDKKEVFSKIDLEHYLQQNKMHNEEEPSEINKELFENALTIGDVKLRECLVPRKEIIGVSQESTLAEIKNIFIETRLSKLVIYDKNIDNITGYIHQLDLFKSPATIQEILLPIPTVPETMNATDLMTKFSKERKTIAWVIDEFGGTAGIVTMEDLLEEIFGEIRDEYDDVEEFTDKQLSDNEFIFSGRVELDFITEKYGLEFPDDEMAETLSGFIVQHNAGIPKEKEQIIIGNYAFNIQNMSDTRIETVKLNVLKRS
ncbi:MAG: hemolysin family protein [Ferruginibacter sp.]